MRLSRALPNAAGTFFQIISRNTATIASDSPGLRDSVMDGETGFLVRHGDVDALAGRVRALVGDAALRERLGRGARSFAERFTWDRAADGTEEFLAGVARPV